MKRRSSSKRPAFTYSSGRCPCPAAGRRPSGPGRRPGCPGPGPRPGLSAAIPPRRRARFVFHPETPLLEPVAECVQLRICHTIIWPAGSVAGLGENDCAPLIATTLTITMSGPLGGVGLFGSRRSRRDSRSRRSPTCPCRARPRHLPSLTYASWLPSLSLPSSVDLPTDDEHSSWTNAGGRGPRRASRPDDPRWRPVPRT